ncbi:fatty acid desaturase [Amylibacter sp. SFDW26]|uniref:fatty acid desaturase n=1 Tax=Amylibacter sp. SFDW26 TaxID=2652722 RepID=UPI0012617775|nr:fatty acid desaturase [Amylibacter sp. SFDW26]KAB7615640.1 fatty acid desaturase [Amylibacter sp. SFDW26]
MDHKTFLSQLDTDTRAKLTERSDTPALIHLGLYWGLMIGLGVYVAYGLPLWWLVLVPLGILISFNFTLLHETVHSTPFKTESFNKIAGRISAFLILLPMDWFRYFHLAHHRHTNDPENDPELRSDKPETIGQYIWHVTGLPVWRGNIGKIIKNATRQNNDPYVPDKGKARVKHEARTTLALYSGVLIALILGQSWIFWCWILPSLIGQPFLRLYLLAEHGRCPPVANMFENTRTTFTNRIVRFVAWNMPYHIEHHTYPSVPFHKLPALHDLVKEELRVTSNGYVEFNKEYVEGITS